jgi:hypothetical protein
MGDGTNVMRRRRTVNPFGMSFLDVMFCGFGSVVLLVMIVNANAITKREELHKDLRGEVDRLEREVLAGEKYLVELRAAIDSIDENRKSVRRMSRQVSTDIGKSRSELELTRQETIARTSHINDLQSDLKNLDSEAKGLQAQLDDREEKGKQVRKFIGAGDRQYLTGLKMGGKRILILVDASASMLDETIVNVIIRRNLPDAQKRASVKWQQAIKTVEWLVSQLPADARFQLFTFNVLAEPVLTTAGAGWIETSDSVQVDKVIDALHQVVPGKGTNLYRAMAAIRSLEPRPDNVYLLTDGLPTQGKSKPSGTTVTGKQRLAYFDQALDNRPENVPVNTILFPMEGDPFAASAFWKLTIASQGSMISPSKDWP